MGVRRRRRFRPVETGQREESVVSDKPVPKRNARPPGARQRPLPDAEIGDGEVSCFSPKFDEATEIRETRFMERAGSSLRLDNGRAEDLRPFLVLDCDVISNNSECNRNVMSHC